MATFLGGHRVQLSTAMRRAFNRFDTNKMTRDVQKLPIANIELVITLISMSDLEDQKRKPRSY